MSTQMQLLAKKKTKPKGSPLRPAFERYEIKELGTVLPLPSKIRNKLNRLSTRQFTFGFWKLALIILLWGAGLLFVQALLDVLFRLPMLVRAVFLVLDAGSFGWLIYIGTTRIRKERLNLGSAALLVQKKWPFLCGSLIAAVEFTENPTGVPHRSTKLIEKLLEQVSPKVDQLRFHEVIPSKPLWRLTGAAVMAWAILGMVAYDISPLGKLLLKRVFLSNEPFPTRTKVIPLSKDIVAGLGDNVQLEARVSGYVPERGLVTIIQADGAVEDLNVTPQPDRPDLFSVTVRNVQKPFRYSFKIQDGVGENYHVSTRITPLVRQIECEVAYPPYTGIPDKKLSLEQISVPEGSTLKIKANASTDLSRATLVFQGWTGKVPMQIDATDHKTATVTLPVMDGSLTGFSISLVDQAGVSSVNDTIYHLEVIADEPPTVHLTKPVDESLTVTSRSKLQIAFDVSDNYGITGITLHFEVTPAAAGSANPSPVEIKPISFDVKQFVSSPTTPSTVTYNLAISDQTPAWNPGDTIRYWAEAVDNNNVTGPGVGRSNVQQLIVVTPEEKRDEILQRLQDNANLMQDVVNDQLQINDQVKDSGSTGK